MSGRLPRGSAAAQLMVGLLLLSLVLSACSAKAQALLLVAATPTPEPAFVATLRPKLAAEMQQLGVPGAIFYVQDGHEGSWTATMGISDISTHAPMNLDDHMRVGSITKTFTGTVILQLVDEGKLHLNDAVAKYQPTVPNGANITIRELLNMTSGLYNYSEDPDFGNTLLAHPDKVWLPEELLGIAFKHHPYFDPGTGFHYSNTNFILLGLIAEQLTGKSLGEEMQRRIFTPLGMHNTSLPALSNAALPTPHPQGYASKASGECPTGPVSDSLHALASHPQEALVCNVTTMNPSWGWAAGAAISTLHDLRIWAQALATGKLLSAATQKERLTWVDIRPDARYGLAIFDVDDLLGHNGELPGFQSFMGYNPDKQQMVLVLTNLDLSTHCAPAATPGGSPDCSPTADTLSQLIIKQVFA